MDGGSETEAARREAVEDTAGAARKGRTHGEAGGASSEGRQSGGHDDDDCIEGRGASKRPPGARVVVVLGPTASGKSKLAVDVALRFNGEVVSADAMQVYKGLDVTTSKVSREEMKGVPHHMLDVADLRSEYTVRAFRDQALKVVDDILKRGKLPVVVGGTNYYIQALISGSLLDDFLADSASVVWTNPSTAVTGTTAEGAAGTATAHSTDTSAATATPAAGMKSSAGGTKESTPSSSAAATNAAECRAAVPGDSGGESGGEECSGERRGDPGGACGGNGLSGDHAGGRGATDAAAACLAHERLARVDPVMASRVHPNDTRRVCRYLEIFDSTGRRPSDIFSLKAAALGRPARPQAVAGPLRYDCCFLRLVVRWPALEATIARRAAAMLGQGLLLEVAPLFAPARSLAGGTDGDAGGGGGCDRDGGRGCGSDDYAGSSGGHGGTDVGACSATGGRLVDGETPNFSKGVLQAIGVREFRSFFEWLWRRQPAAVDRRCHDISDTWKDAHSATSAGMNAGSSGSNSGSRSSGSSSRSRCFVVSNVGGIESSSGSIRGRGRCCTVDSGCRDGDGDDGGGDGGIGVGGGVGSVGDGCGGGAGGGVGGGGGGGGGGFGGGGGGRSDDHIFCSSQRVSRPPASAPARLLTAPAARLPVGAGELARLANEAIKLLAASDAASTTLATKGGSMPVGDDDTHRDGDSGGSSREVGAQEDEEWEVVEEEEEDEGGGVTEAGSSTQRLPGGREEAGGEERRAELAGERMLAAALAELRLTTCRLARKQSRWLDRFQSKNGWRLQEVDATPAHAGSSNAEREAAWEAAVLPAAAAAVELFLRQGSAAATDRAVAATAGGAHGGADDGARVGHAGERGGEEGGVDAGDPLQLRACEACRGKLLRGNVEWLSHIRSRQHRRRSGRKRADHAAANRLLPKMDDSVTGDAGSDQEIVADPLSCLFEMPDALRE